MTISQQVSMIQSSQTHSTELVQKCFERIHQLNPQVNAFVTLNEENALKQALQADKDALEGKPIGKLHGIPFSLKDSYSSKGIRTTYGVPEHKNTIPGFDATVLQKLLNEGAILVGKTSTPFASFDWQCNHPVSGVCNNPWDLSKTPGGSSGGAAAAVAAGFSLFDVGSDIAGSIRVPSHYCGVWGFRPTENAVSSFGHAPAPDLPQLLPFLCSFGPLTRSAKDLQLLFEIISGGDAKQNWIPPFRSAPENRPNNRVLLLREFKEAPVCSGTQKMLDEVSAFLKKQNVEVVETQDMGFDVNESLYLWGVLCGAFFIPGLPSVLKYNPFRWIFQLGLISLWFGSGVFSKGLTHGLRGDWSSFFRALTRRKEILDQFEKKMQGFDAFLSPISSTSAFTHRKRSTPVWVDQQKVPYANVNSYYNCPTAVMGCPSIAVPWKLDQDSCPLGFQMIGKQWSDFSLLDLACKLEEQGVGIDYTPLDSKPML